MNDLIVPESARWPFHATLLAGLGLFVIAAAFALGTDHPHGLFDDAFLLGVGAVFWGAHALLTTAIVANYGITNKRVIFIHLAVLFCAPTMFGIAASIVA